MRDALGDTDTALVLGATSEIAAATVLALARRRTTNVVLAVRDPAQATPLVKECEQLGVTTTVVKFDATDPVATHRQMFNNATAVLGDIDVTLVAFGQLGDAAVHATRPEAALELVKTNTVGGWSVLGVAAEQIRHQGHGSIVVLSSVAAVRPRPSNFAYGASKAGLDWFAQGLDAQLRLHGGHILIVRPGFVTTRMTAHLPAAPLSVDPGTVADAIVDGLQHHKRIIYVPKAMGLVAGVLTVLPWGVLRRLPI
ncbi:MAG: SDR family NAD(P)-dependent oxidoreductase [Euzebya sp.]